MKKSFFILICLVGFLYCCNNHSNSDLEENVDDELAEGEITLDDTLRLEEGIIPENWIKVSLQDGYYIGFPKEPRKKESKSNQRIDFKLKRSKYRLYISLTDLSKEPSFQKNKKYRTTYYNAIVDDLSESIEAEIESEQTFYSQEIYEGMRATVVAEDARVYLQCIIIGSMLYTASLTLFVDENPAYLQLRDKFFYSFGNDKYKRRNELEKGDTTNRQQDTLR